MVYLLVLKQVEIEVLLLALIQFPNLIRVFLLEVHLGPRVVLGQTQLKERLFVLEVRVMH